MVRSGRPKGQGVPGWDERAADDGGTGAVNLILLEAGEVGGDGVASIAGTRADHITDVLKGAPAETVRVGIVDGPAGHGVITSIHGGVVELRCAFETVLPQRPAV